MCECLTHDRKVNQYVTYVAMLAPAGKRVKYNIGHTIKSDAIANSLKESDDLDMCQLDRLVFEDLQCKFKQGRQNLHEPWLQSAHWTRWLWDTDPCRPCSHTLMLNENHLMGLIICRYLASRRDESSSSMLDELIPGKNLCAHQIPVMVMNLKQLRDTVQNIQLNWTRLSIYTELRASEVLDACMARVGELAHLGGGVDILNDQGSVQDHNRGILSLTNTCIRRFLTVLLVLYRHLDLEKRCIRIGNDADIFDCKILLHHVQASRDDFVDLAFHWSLMPAAKLNYMHDFPGMYNTVSQVVYFHDAKYVPLIQNVDYANISVGRADAVHVIPAIRELYPSIGLVYDDVFMPAFCQGTENAFMVISQKVYLITPQRTVMYHPNVTILLKCCLENII